eukprot:TRINITY_DN8943_c0_g1_i1.p1 TRINITY_DN8943_c0_g1~~TRINITY_DN8943_c0_g1_i1.p1  ORF type:complete len:410 (-),score=119.67 TRINITY_DN8943_c0_g1_i1:62-1264(-)
MGQAGGGGGASAFASDDVGYLASQMRAYNEATQALGPEGDMSGGGGGGGAALSEPQPFATAGGARRYDALDSALAGFGGLDLDDGAEVRAPAPRLHDTLIHTPVSAQQRGGAMMPADSALQLPNAEGESTEWLFPPPTDMIERSSFSDTRQACRQSKKWIMVNIQDRSVFASHRLNRDVWSDETVRALVSESFVFWQREATSEDAQGFCERYSVRGDALPVTAIIDPRTGGMLVRMEGFISPEDMSSLIMEFMESHSMERLPSTAPKLRVIGRKSSFAGHEDESSDYAANHSADEAYEDAEAAEEAQDEALPDEPPADAPNATRVQIRLADGGSTVTRRFLLTTPATVLFQLVKQQVPEAAAGRPFELASTFPRRTVSASSSQTLAEADLANSALVMRWS